MSSILIKGMQMPKEDELLCIRIYPSGKVTVDMDLQCKQIAEAVELPKHGALIDQDELYNGTTRWEEEALKTIKGLSLGESEYSWEHMEFIKWSAILTERSAFKRDVIEAPVVIASERSEE